MPKSRKAKRTPTAKSAAPAKKTTMTRRTLLQSAGFYGVGALVVAGGGYWGVTSFGGKMAEQDMSVVGSGMPTIVQVHDPACQICTGLQREARAALAQFEDGELAYRVANIKSDAGLAFATEHGSSYATLLFFDGDGNLTRRIRGATDRNTLHAAFLAHLSGS